jgi:Cu(I)/Ag(I) efflux system membrane fusion protein
MSDSFIDNLEATQESVFRVPYYAPYDAVVSELAIREGMYVEPTNQLMTLANLETVWVLADVFEHQIEWVEQGKWVEFDLPAIGVYAIEGQIDYLYPALDAKTRTLKVRLSLSNINGKFKPDMLANVRIYGGPKRDVLNIPVEALIRTGKQNRVVVQQQGGSFVSRKVTVGTVTQGRAEVQQGLSENERVVTSGQFLIDSESNIRSAILKMSRGSLFTQDKSTQDNPIRDKSIRDKSTQDKSPEDMPAESTKSMHEHHH